MKKLLILLCLSLTFSDVSAQNTWFNAFTDSTALVKEASDISKQFKSSINQLNPALGFDVKVIKNTTPYLIFIKNGTVNLPYWEEVIAPQKKFFAEVAGGEQEGKEVFGLFFNGFYLAHELGHSLADLFEKKYNDAYSSEYDANVLGILYWRKVGQERNLERCYQYAKKMLKTLKNPVPEGEEYKTYITQNYNKLASDPYKYGFIQFSQFVEIYENGQLPDFDAYVKNGMKF